MEPAATDVVDLARSLIDIESTSGGEAQVTDWLAAWLRRQGYVVSEQPVADDRVNIIATIGTDDPEIVFSTHIDCVPPFFPSRIEGDVLYGRGACDAKGVLAAEILALERFRVTNEPRVGLLVVVGEEHGSHGAKAANKLANRCRYLINGEPTDSRLAVGTKGAYRVRVAATGRAAHSAYPELGESAIDKLLDALMTIRSLDLPSDEKLGQATCTIGLIQGGVAPNVVPPEAEADVNFRIVGPSADIRALLEARLRDVTIENVMDVPVMKLTTLPGFDGGVFSFTTDIPFLANWGQPLLFGPGSIHVAHTAEERVAIPELVRAIDLYESLAKQLVDEA